MSVLGRRGRIALLVLGIVAGAVLVLVVYAVLVAAVNSSENNERGESREPQVARNDATLEAVRENTRVIKDCTDPEGSCFKEGQRRTAAAVSEIGSANILAVVCALQVPDGTPLELALDLVTGCVSERLK